MTPDALFVEYYAYEVDDLLHRLVDTTLESRIHRLYLHALTSHPLVDQFTGHTELKKHYKVFLEPRPFPSKAYLRRRYHSSKNSES